MWTTDTCHAATLVRTISVENFGDGLLHQDCHNHPRNVWVGGLDKELSSYLTNLLRSIIDEIDPTLRVKTLYSALACSYYKGFSLSANYPKGFVELSVKCIMDKHPGCVLYHVERVRGSIQDMILEVSLAIYMN